MCAPTVRKRPGKSCQNSSLKVNYPFSCASIRYSYSAEAFMPSPEKVLQLRFGIELPKQTSPSREEPKVSHTIEQPEGVQSPHQPQEPHTHENTLWCPKVLQLTTPHNGGTARNHVSPAVINRFRIAGYIAFLLICYSRGQRNDFEHRFLTP